MLVGGWYPGARCQHAEIDASPKAMFTMVSSSAMATAPSLLQSPTHIRGVASTQVSTVNSTETDTRCCEWYDAP
jgi:hypothetical protein